MDGETVEVDAGEFRKEWHNYTRTLMVISASCILAVAGSYIYNLQWQSRTDERLKNTESRLDKTDLHLNTLDTKFNDYSSQVNSRLGVIEERTGSLVDGIKRVEGKIDKK